MPKIEYIHKSFRPATLAIIEQANAIINEYTAEGLQLTLRQLYYQFVSRDLIANKSTEYDRLGQIISDARLAGLIDWYAIEDRARNLKTYYHNTDPGQAVQDALDHYNLDKWKNQDYRIEVWIEKEALTGVIHNVCEEHDVPYFACKGYVSQSEMWRAGRRAAQHRRMGQTLVIIHLGDHDPSGIDMTRDIFDRYALFSGVDIDVRRIALNADQIDLYDPPPNPAKMTDSRFKDYAAQYGTSSWELDALEPRVIRDLIASEIAQFTDQDKLDETEAAEEAHKEILGRVVENWETL